ncbi:MAG TPA: 2Fe-2S iron-sulfur cluster-binding protein [Candidatus Poseidoniaceae archaeon]|nr:2Fe-2S iron-sulfur cluster-binding protein [Candidatus Poseidoniaceae archaeon]
MHKENKSLSGVIRFFRGSQLLGLTKHNGKDTICELSELCEVNIPTNCTSGTCGTCMVTLNSGIVLLPEELPPGLDSDLIENMARLSCIGVPSGDVDIEVRPPL